jgi:hypothetical protein
VNEKIHGKHLAQGLGTGYVPSKCQLFMYFLHPEILFFFFFCILTFLESVFFLFLYFLSSSSFFLLLFLLLVLPLLPFVLLDFKDFALTRQALCYLIHTLNPLL